MNFSLILPLLVTLSGAFLLVKFRFFFIVHPIKTAKDFLVALHDRDARRSLFLALAGTLGVGNIFGVAAGIMIGGAGSLFWLFVSSVFAMVIKYAETLTVFDSRIERGGTSALLSKTFRSHGAILSSLYAFLMLLLSLLMGAGMQGVAVMDVAESGLSIAPIFSGLIFVILIMPCIIGTAKTTESITEILIPLTTIIYILMCFWTIIVNFAKISAVINNIIFSAFEFKSVAGGLSFVAVREGFARGILSNEAGAGTSAMAHCRSRSRDPHTAGLFAMAEVVFDSSVLCMLTGFVILLTVPDVSLYRTPMSLVCASFYSVFGRFSDVILPFIILSFAYATVICWYYYGRECVSLYFSVLKGIYPFLFIMFLLLSRFIRSDFLLYVIDVLLLFMCFMTLSAIARRTHVIAELYQIKKET